MVSSLYQETTAANLTIFCSFTSMMEDKKLRSALKFMTLCVAYDEDFRVTGTLTPQQVAGSPTACVILYCIAA